MGLITKVGQIWFTVSGRDVLIAFVRFKCVHDTKEGQIDDVHSLDFIHKSSL